MSSIRSKVRDFLPPIVSKAIQKWRGDAIQFEGDFSSWDAASARCTGYDAEHILSKVLDATRKVKRGEAVFERDSVLFDEIQHNWSTTAGLMWAAARNGGKLSVLDFGGALGSTYFQNNNFLQGLPEVHWGIVEQAHYVEAGRLHIQDARLRFYKTIKECLAENKPNVILLASVLQYLQSPDSILAELSDVGATCVIVDRTPFSNSRSDSIVIQRVPDSIYLASYPMWVFSKRNFINRVGGGCFLIGSSQSPEGFIQSADGMEFSFEGMILKSCKS